jgi:hypothetical protein
MKLDMELVRTILLKIEESPEDPNGWIDLNIPTSTAKQLSYHIQLLDEAGFIEAIDVSTMDDYTFHAKRMTYRGHQLLDDIRDPIIWRKTKEGAKQAGKLGLEFIWELAKAYGKERFGLAG